MSREKEEVWFWRVERGGEAARASSRVAGTAFPWGAPVLILTQDWVGAFIHPVTLFLLGWATNSPRCYYLQGNMVPWTTVGVPLSRLVGAANKSRQLAAQHGSSVM